MLEKRTYSILEITLSARSMACISGIDVEEPETFRFSLFHVHRSLGTCCQKTYQSPLRLTANAARAAPKAGFLERRREEMCARDGSRRDTVGRASGEKREPGGNYAKVGKRYSIRRSATRTVRGMRQVERRAIV